MFYRDIDLFYEPEKECNQLTEGKNRKYSEMTLFQQAFLCGLIREKRPEKVVEIGVAGGGTTAVILTCLKMLGGHSEMFSVDSSEKWYRNEMLDTGFVAKEYMDFIVGEIKHKFYLGKIIPYVIDEIRDDIDFLILDTTHSMPGEFMDFLVCLPYLRDGCIVVLHDVMENHGTCNDCEMATKLLFNMARGGKWYSQEKETGILGFSNIAAFEVNEEMRRNIDDLFFALTFSWSYLLEDKDVGKYKELIKRNFGIEYASIFQQVFDLQKYTYICKCINNHYHMGHQILKMKWEKQKEVFIYGGGYWARIYLEYAQINRLPLAGIVISDDQIVSEVCIEGKKIYKLKDLPYSPEECTFVLALDTRYFVQVRRNLERRGYYMIL